MSTQTVVIEKLFGENKVRFREDGWFCATDAAKLFDKEVFEWLRLPETSSYIDAYLRFHYRENPGNENVILAKRGPVKNGGGTWLHPRLAVVFTRWLNIDFGVWCDAQIQHILTNQRHMIEDWNVARSETKSSNKFRNSQVDAFEGRVTQNFVKYSMELWFICGGSFKNKIEREELTTDELRILRDIERCQAVLIELQQDWCDVDTTFKRRQILINRVNRLRAEVGLEEVDHSVFWNKAQVEYAKKVAAA